MNNSSGWVGNSMPRELSTAEQCRVGGALLASPTALELFFFFLASQLKRGISLLL